MNRSHDRILTTHTGSLERPPELLHLLIERDAGRPYDVNALDAGVRKAVEEVVRRQVDTGLSSVNDGEMGKISFANYISDRLTGFGGVAEPRPESRDDRSFPNWAARRQPAPQRQACDSPIAWRDFAAVERDLENLSDAAAKARAGEVFMTSASPGTLANFFANHYYPDRKSYLDAIVQVMRREYEAIVKAGFVLQIDGPDLALHDQWFPDYSLDDFREVVRENIAAINQAVSGLPTQQIRVHVCWGAAERPHANDAPLADLVDLLLTALPVGLSIVGANGRHQHEHRLWRTLEFPADKVLIPGVIDSTSNIVEHPEVVAERIIRYAQAVGPENLIAGVDCGFGTVATRSEVDGDVAFAKLRSLVEGAALASRELL